jgi:hypothetical protein
MNGYLVYILNLSLSSVIQRVSNRPSLSFIKNVHFIFFSEKWRQQREMVSPHVVPVHVCRAHTPAIFHCNACEQVLRIKENFRRSSRGGGGATKGMTILPAGLDIRLVEYRFGHEIWSTGLTRTDSILLWDGYGFDFLPAGTRRISENSNFRFFNLLVR